MTRKEREEFQKKVSKVFRDAGFREFMFCFKDGDSSAITLGGIKGGDDTLERIKTYAEEVLMNVRK